MHALKNLQVEFLKVESEFYREVQLLEAKYMKQYQPLLDKVTPHTSHQLPTLTPPTLTPPTLTAEGHCLGRL